MMKCRLRVLVDAELDLAALDVGDGLGGVHGDGAGLRVRHQAARAEHLAEPADLAHEVGGRDDGVEVEPAARHLLEQVVGADVVGAGGLGGLGLVTVGEDEHAGGLAGAVREVDGAAHHLVGLARVDAEAEGDLDGLVVLRRRGRLREAHGLERGCRPCPRRSSRRRTGRTCCASSAAPGVSEVESWSSGQRRPCHWWGTEVGAPPGIRADAVGTGLRARCRCPSDERCRR